MHESRNNTEYSHGTITRNLQSSCSFNELFASICSLVEYCQSLRGEQGITATCSGDIGGEWNILIQFDELCYPSQAREDSFARNTGDTQAALPEFGFCSIESAYFNFRVATLENSQHQEIVTYPKEAKGLLQQVTLYTPCGDSVADSFFGRGYCADPCPQTKLQGSLQCQEQCIVCSDGKQVLDCSNIHPTLVEECGNESTFMGALLAYLKAESSGSLASEEQEENAEKVDDLEPTDNGGDGKQNDNEAPSAGDGTAAEDESANKPTGVENSNTTGLNTSDAFVMNTVRYLAFLLPAAIISML